MKDIPLSEFVKARSQELVAQRIGVTQSGLSQMLRSGRSIYVRFDSCGRLIAAYEVKPVGSLKVVKGPVPVECPAA